MTASSSGFEPGLEAEPVFAAEVEDFLDDVALLVHLDRVDADVAPLVAVLVDRRLEGVVDVAEPVPQDVGEAEQHRQPDAAELQVIGELLQVDRARRILGRVGEDVAFARRSRSSPCPTDRARTARWRR